MIMIGVMKMKNKINQIMEKCHGYIMAKLEAHNIYINKRNLIIHIIYILNLVNLKQDLEILMNLDFLILCIDNNQATIHINIMNILKMAKNILAINSMMMKIKNDFYCFVYDNSMFYFN